MVLIWKQKERQMQKDSNSENRPLITKERFHMEASFLFQPNFELFHARLWQKRAVTVLCFLPWILTFLYQVTSTGTLRCSRGDVSILVPRTTISFWYFKIS